MIKHYDPKEEARIITTNWNRIRVLCNNNNTEAEKKERNMRTNFHNSYACTEEGTRESDEILSRIEKTIQNIDIKGNEKKISKARQRN